MPVELAGEHGVGDDGVHPVQGLRLQVRQRLDRDQPAGAQHPDPVGDPLHLAEHVRGQQHGAAGRGVLADQRVELLLHQRVQAAGRLVEHQQVRVAHPGQHDRELLPVAAGQLARGPVQVEAEPQRELLGALGGVLAAQRLQVGHVPAAGEPAVERGVARHVAGPTVHGPRLAPGVVAQHPGLPRRRPQQPHQQPQGGGLAGAVGAEVAEDLARPEGQVDVRERDGAAEGLAESPQLDGHLAAHGTSLAVVRPASQGRRARSPLRPPTRLGT